jgi:hypothetical protein
MQSNIPERAANKAFAKIITLEDEVKQLQFEVKNNRVGALSLDQLESVLYGTQLELETWKYINELIEKAE